MKKSLLDELTAQMGCLYLSDLRIFVGTESLANCIATIPEGEYSLAVWNECVHYLTTATKRFSTEKEAREYLKSQKAAQ